MTTFGYDIGIIGGGAAGLTVAAGAARFGAKTLLIEKSRSLGGDCLHTGCVPSKSLLRAASLRALAARFREFGLPPVALPPVDLGEVMDRVGEVIGKIQLHDSVERFEGLGAKVVFGGARFTDDHTVEVEGRSFSARAWVIATGSRPALAPVEGLAGVSPWTSDTLFSQRKLPERLLVLGGGPMGLEIAQAFVRLGSRVTVVEYAAQLLGAEDPDVAAVVAERLEAEGIEFLTGTRAVLAERSGSSIDLTVTPSEGGGEPRVISGDAVFAATGRRPNVEGLDLEKAGVRYAPGGIPTDAHMRTSVPHIYACGDVNGVYPFTHVAGAEGSVALSNAILHLPRRMDYGSVPWCTYTDPEAAGVGLNERRAAKAGVEFRVLKEHFSDNDRAVADGETGGMIKVLTTPRGVVLGCQIVGPRAGELIHEWVAAVSGGLKLSRIAGMVHSYPTLSEISKRAAGNFYAEKLFGRTSRTLLRVLFGLRGRG